MGSDELMKEVRSYPARWQRLKTPRDRAIWCFIVSAAGHLEDLAAYALWEHEGRFGNVEHFLEKLTLGQFHKLLGKPNLVSDRALKIVKSVGELRNAVVHRHGTYGAADPKTPQGRPLGMYEGGHVFRNRLALRRLVDDVGDARSALVAAAMRSKKAHEEHGSNA